MFNADCEEHKKMLHKSLCENYPSLNLDKEEHIMMIDARTIVGDKKRDRYHLGQHPQMAEEFCNTGDLKVLEQCFNKDVFNRLRQGGKVTFTF